MGNCLSSLSCVKGDQSVQDIVDQVKLDYDPDGEKEKTEDLKPLLDKTRGLGSVEKSVVPHIKVLISCQVFRSISQVKSKSQVLMS